MTTLQIRSGYKPHELGTYRTPHTVYEMITWCDSHSHIEVRDRLGNARRVKVNGKVRTWKRDTNRIEVPCKYGLYEYFILTAHDIEDVLIPTKDGNKEN